MAHHGPLHCGNARVGNREVVERCMCAVAIDEGRGSVL
jgi:hypothetical protein